MRAIGLCTFGGQHHGDKWIHDPRAAMNLTREFPQLCITAFCRSPVHIHNRKGDWIVGRHQGVLLDQRAISFQATPRRAARWENLLSSGSCEGDDEGESKKTRPREKAGMDRSHSPAKSSGTGRNRTGKKPKPLKPGLY